MLSDISNKFVNVVGDGWTWWWDGNSPSEGQIARAAFTVFIPVLLMVSWYTRLIKNIRKKELPLPPGPRGLPLVGSLPFLEANLHRYFARLAQTYGPIFTFKIGSKLNLVLSSPASVREALRDNDSIFANRDAPAAGLTASYGGRDILWCQNGPRLRELRKLLVHEFLSPSNLDNSIIVREREVGEQIREVYAKVGTPVEIREHMFLTVNNVVMSMLWGGSLQGEARTRIGLEFRHLVAEIVILLAKPNVSDIFPILAPFDLQGIERRLKKSMVWFDKIFDSIMEQRSKSDKDGQNKKSKDFMELLSDANASLTTLQLKALLLDVIVAATDTASITLEWAIAEMIKNPETMKRAIAELDEVVGKDNKVHDSHLSSLHYLDSVIKEALRFYPPAPLLIPHCSSATCTVGGYTIPKGTRVFFNVWAMHRDPEAWEDALTFKPERFLTNNIDYKGTCFNFLPFGAGRRMCVGTPLAERLMLYTLASFLHSFHLSMPDGKEVDLSDTFGLVLKMTTPLVVIPTPRLSNPELYN